MALCCAVLRCAAAPATPTPQPSPCPRSFTTSKRVVDEMVVSLARLVLGGGSGGWGGEGCEGGGLGVGEVLARCLRCAVVCSGVPRMPRCAGTGRWR